MDLGQIAIRDNVLVCGGKRTGKTTLIRRMVGECLRVGRSVLVADCCDEYRMPGEVVVLGDERVSERLAGAVLASSSPYKLRVLVRHPGPDVLDGIAQVLHHLRDITVVVDEHHAYCRSSLTAPRSWEAFVRMDTGSNHRGSSAIIASQLPDVPVGVRCSMTRVALLRMMPEHLRRMYARGIIDRIYDFESAERPYPLGYQGQVFWI